MHLKNLCSLASIAVGLASRGLVVAQTVINPTDTMTITNINASPDGFTRPVIAVNGEYPSPLIKAQKGDNFQLNVVNQLTDPTMLRQTSIHWHGIFQHQTAWADGPDGVTQCPIAQSGESFTYAFNAGQEAGTYWYHSHFGTQYCDGLRGPLVVYDVDDPHKDLYNVDDETTIITLADWYHQQAPSIQGAATSQATLINGKGRQPNGDPNAEIAVITVQKGQKYRLRIVSLSCDPNYQFSIDNHSLTIIEADGQATEPLVVDRLQIFAGQRYSVVLDANQDENIGNFWIRAVPNVGAANLPNFSEGGINSAILRYAGANAVDPTTSAQTNPLDLQESNLHALLNPTPPGGSAPADVPLTLALGFANGLFTVNGASWATPDSPVMVQIMNGVPAANVVPAGSIHILPRNAVVELSVPGLALAGPHPFHLHGHAFSVIRSAGSSATNFVNPVRRDVVNLGGNTDNVTIRFTTDNPGPWFFHCHIEFHLVAGLATVFIEAPDDIASNSPPPSAWSDLCPKFDALDPSATSIQIVPTPTA